MFGLFETSASLALVGMALWARAILLETLGKRMSNPRADARRDMQTLMNTASRQMLDNMTSVIIPKSPPLPRMTATEVRHKQEAARKVMTRKSFIPELWSQKLLDDFAKDGIMGDFVKSELVGPDWPEYQGVSVKAIRDRHVDIQASALARRIEDHITDALVYGMSVVHLNVKS